MDTELPYLHYFLPHDARIARSFAKDAIDSRNANWSGLGRYFLGMGATTALSCVNTVSYAALSVVQPVSLILKAHPRKALSKAGENLCKAVGSLAFTFFSFGLTLATFVPKRYLNLSFFRPIITETTKQKISRLENWIIRLQSEIKELEDQLHSQLANIETLGNEKVTLEQTLNEQNALLLDEQQKSQRQRELFHDLLSDAQAIRSKLTLVTQQLEIAELKLEINKLDMAISQIQVDNKQAKLWQVRTSMTSESMTGSIAESPVGEHKPTDNREDNVSLLLQLTQEKEIKEMQLTFLQTESFDEHLAGKKMSLADLPYPDPQKAHKFTVHLDAVVEKVGEDTIKEALGETLLSKALCNNGCFTPEGRYKIVISQLREMGPYFQGLPADHVMRKVLYTLMTGVCNDDYLIKTVDRILHSDPTQAPRDPLDYLLWANKLAKEAPQFFLATVAELLQCKGEGAAGIKDFFLENLPNLRGWINIAGEKIGFLRAPTPAMPYYDNKAAQVASAVYNIGWRMATGQGGNGEVLAPEEEMLCQELKRQDKSMLVAVHELLTKGSSERGRCELRLKLEEKYPKTYKALFQPYDGPLYDKVQGTTFDELKEVLKNAYCHNDPDNEYGCLLPLHIRSNSAKLQEYREKVIPQLVEYVKKVYFPNGEFKLDDSFKIPEELKKSKHFKPELMAQRIFMHGFYIAQSEFHMKNANFFKSQCKDAQDRTGMEALAQETQYALRVLEGAVLEEELRRLVKKNIGQCLSNKGATFHGQRFCLGSVFYGYMLHRLRNHDSDAWNAFINCEHLGDGVKIEGMDIPSVDNAAEVTYKNATSRSAFANSLAWHYHNNVREVTKKGKSLPADDFKWQELELTYLPTRVKFEPENLYDFNNEQIISHDALCAKNKGRSFNGDATFVYQEFYQHISSAAERQLREAFQGATNNDNVGLVFNVGNVKNTYSANGSRILVMRMPVELKQENNVVADCEAYMQVDLTQIRNKRLNSSTYQPQLPPVRFAWRLKSINPEGTQIIIDDQEPDQAALIDRTVPQV